MKDNLKDTRNIACLRGCFYFIITFCWIPIDKTKQMCYNILEDGADVFRFVIDNLI